MGQTVDIDVDVEEITTAIENIRTAQAEFQEFKKNLFTNERSYLEGMNSDFVDKLDRVLELIESSDLESFDTALTDYVLKVEGVKDILVEADTRKAVNG